AHSATHANLAGLSFREVFQEMRGGRKQIERILHRRVSLFRPPRGYLDLRVAAASRLLGLKVVLWSVDPDDWCPGVTSAEILDRSSLRAGDVLLLHDGLCDPVAELARDRTSTIQAVRLVVREARAQGLNFVSLGGQYL